MTFPMDKEGNLFLTVKVVIIQANKDVDIATITLQSLNQQKKGTCCGPDNMLDIESDSDDEQELGGGELMDHLQYFYDVYKVQENNANKIRKVSSEMQATPEESKDSAGGITR